VTTADGIQKPIIVSPSDWLLSMSPAKTRAEIVARWASDLTSFSPGPGLPNRSVLQAPPELSTEQAALWTNGVAAVQKIIDNYNEKHADDPMSNDPATILAELVSWARKQKLAESKAANALAAAVEVARASLAQSAATGPQATNPDGSTTNTPAVSVEDLPRLETLLVKAVEGERQRPQVIQTRERTMQRHAHLAASIEQFNKDFATFQSLTAPDAAKLPELTKLYNDAHKMHGEGAVLSNLIPGILKMVDSSPMNCPVCLSVYDQASTKNRIEDLFKTLTEQLVGVKAYMDNAKLNLDGHNQAIYEYESLKTRLGNEHKRISEETVTVQKLVAEMPEVYSGESSEQIRHRVAAARALSAARDAVNAQEVQLHRHENANIVAQRVEQAAGLVLSRITETVAARVRDAVNPHLSQPMKGRFVFDLDGFAMIGADGRPHKKTEQSGAEFTSLKLALAKAWASGGPYILCLDYKEDLADFDGYGGLEQALETIEKTALEDPNCLLVLITSPLPLPVSQSWYVQKTRPDVVAHTKPLIEQQMPPTMQSNPAVLAAIGVPATRSMFDAATGHAEGDEQDGLSADHPEPQAEPVPAKRKPGRPRKNPAKPQAPATKGRGGR